MVVAKDSSGNGLDGTYVSLDSSPITFVPGLVPGDLALRSGYPNTLIKTEVDIPPTLAWANPWSVLWWQADTPAWSGKAVRVYETNGPDSALEISMEPDNGFALVFQFGSWATSAGGLFPTDGLGHFGVVTYPGGTSGPPSLYYDGAPAAFSTFVTGPAFNNDPFATATLGASGFPAEILDEVATFTSELTAGDVAALYAAASSSFAAWTAAVLALSPASFYHLDDGTRGWVLGSVGMS